MSKLDIGIILLLIAAFNCDKSIGGFLVFLGLWLIFIDD